MLTGSLVAIVTPMLEDGSLDLARFKSLIDWHVAEGTQGIVRRRALPANLPLSISTSTRN